MENIKNTYKMCKENPKEVLMCIVIDLSTIFLFLIMSLITLSLGVEFYIIAYNILPLIFTIINLIFLVIFQLNFRYRIFNEILMNKKKANFKLLIDVFIDSFMNVISKSLKIIEEMLILSLYLFILLIISCFFLSVIEMFTRLNAENIFINLISGIIMSIVFYGLHFTMERKGNMYSFLKKNNVTVLLMGIIYSLLNYLFNFDNSIWWCILFIGDFLFTLLIINCVNEFSTEEIVDNNEEFKRIEVENLEDY